jgi:RimJ/RimL family protein N-acetyltransferase
MKSDVVFETERLYARLWRPEEDAPGAFAMYGDPEMVRFIGGKLSASIEEQRQTLATVCERNKRWNDRMGSWPLFDKVSHELVGCGILKPPPASGTDGKEFSEEIEIGWHVVRKMWGRGLATETGRALLAHGFDVLEVPVLGAVVEAANARSLAVARRIGMRHTGRTNRFYDQELEHFELAAEEWRKFQATGSA